MIILPYFNFLSTTLEVFNDMLVIIPTTTEGDFASVILMHQDSNELLTGPRKKGNYFYTFIKEKGGLGLCACAQVCLTLHVFVSIASLLLADELGPAPPQNNDSEEWLLGQEDLPLLFLRRDSFERSNPTFRNSR